MKSRAVNLRRRYELSCKFGRTAYPYGVSRNIMSVKLSKALLILAARHSTFWRGCSSASRCSSYFLVAWLPLGLVIGGLETQAAKCCGAFNLVLEILCHRAHSERSDNRRDIHEYKSYCRTGIVELDLGHQHAKEPRSRNENGLPNQAGL
jgi:hypothetical protein